MKLAVSLGWALLWVALAPPIQAQSASPDSLPVPRISDVVFQGNAQFSDYDLSLRIRSKANREFLGIGGFRWWLWLYQLGDSGRLGKRLGRALTASGEPPAYLDPLVVQADQERLKVFYQQEGFREVAVEVRNERINDRWAKLVFVIAEGPPTFVRTVSYEGLDRVDPDDRREMVSKSLISGTVVGDRQIRAENERYSEPKLLEERRRILDYLHDRGFATVSRDSIRAVVIPVRPDSFDLRMVIGTGVVHHFGSVRFEVAGPEERARPRADTLLTHPRGAVSAAFSTERKLDPMLLRRALRFQPGEQYNRSRVLETKRRLEATGVFAFTNIGVQFAPDTLTPPALSHFIELRTRQRHRIKYEWFMLQRGGVLGGTDTELGMGVGVSYRNANLLGSGETFSVRTSGSIAADRDFKLFTSTQAEVSISVDYPYLIAPFRGLDRPLNLYNAGSHLSVSLLTARRDELKLIVRGRGTARFRLDLHHSPTITSFVDVLDVSLSNPDTLSGFGRDFLDPLLASIQDDPVQRARIIEDYTQPQVNDAIRYTLRSALVNPLRREEGYSYESSIELGGSIMSLFDRYVFSSGVVEGSLPGLPFFRQGGSRQRLVYRPYVRLRGDARQYRRMGRNTVFAWKAIAGLAHPTGKSNVVPFDRRFFSGGAFSVRGWGLGELGPGAASLVASSAETPNILGGDIKLEASAELRQTAFRNVLAAEWIFALFADAGNVWFGPRNPGLDVPDLSGRFRFGHAFREIGVGSGLGIRIAWEYLIIRLDHANKVYDPAQRSAGVFPEGIRKPLAHFGIGHTF